MSRKPFTRWTPERLARIEELIQEQDLTTGPINWNVIATEMGTSVDSCKKARERRQPYRDARNKNPWTPGEDEILLQHPELNQVEIHDQYLPKRTPDGIRQRRKRLEREAKEKTDALVDEGLEELWEGME
jgi:hypothetical protein